jgi:DNA-binding FadR family transcriptional regulator
MGSTSNGRAAAPAVPVRRVQKAYEQVADQLRTLIVSGELKPGMRLPTEADLARQFGVSRATVREALRVLTTQSLLNTSKGAGGGSYVTLPTVDHISEFLDANVGILTATQTVSLDDFMKLRELLEVPAARMAAENRSDEDLKQLTGAIPDGFGEITSRDQYLFNKEFHSAVAEATGNTLLYVAAQPIFSVLNAGVARSKLGKSFAHGVHDDHEKILAAIKAGDGDAAAEEMQRHLEALRPEYERAWVAPGELTANGLNGD